MLSKGAWGLRSSLLRAGATVVMATVFALPAYDRAAAQDDRYPFVAAPRPAPEPAEPKEKRGRPAHPPAVERGAPRPEPPATTTAVPPPNAPTTVPPRNPALDGVALDPSWPKQVFVIADSVMLGA